MIKIGITGSIGCGKSYIAEKIKQLGIPVYDSDREAKRLMTSSIEIRTNLTNLLGTDAYISDKQLNKRLIADYLFASKENAKRINAVVHPAVKADFEIWAEKQHCPAVALECAILYESGFNKLTDAVIAVSAPKELCIKRAMARDRVTKEEIERRMAFQMTNQERCAQTPFVLLNDGSAHLDNRIAELLIHIKALKKKAF